jgi:hypothetical protein
LIHVDYKVAEVVGITLALIVDGGADLADLDSASSRGRGKGRARGDVEFAVAIEVGDRAGFGAVVVDAMREKVEGVSRLPGATSGQRRRKP